MTISDLIEQLLNEMISSSDGSVEIRRNILANQLNCVPSQINYVISTRFSPERGYSVESRRGGGGSIRITKTAPETSNLSCTLSTLSGTVFRHQVPMP